MDLNSTKTAIDAVLESNQLYAPHYDPMVVSPRPRLHLAVITCMDTRLSYRAMGLQPGDAHLIRNLLGTKEIMIVNHTDCGLMKATEDELHQRIEEDAGVPASTPVTFHAFSDVEQNVREQMIKLSAHSWIGDTAIRGFVFDVHDGRLREILP